MKIGIDARALRNRRGIGNVVFQLLQGLSKIPYDCSFVIYVDDFKSIELIPQDSRFSVRVLRPKIYPIWEQVTLPFHVIQDKLDILHCTGNSAPFFLPRSVKLVLSIMDVIFMFPASQLPKSPSWYQRIGREYLKFIVPFVAKRAAAITTISSASCNDILKYIDVPADHINVIWLAANNPCGIIADVDKLSAMRRNFLLNGPYVLALGALDPRKNTETILISFEKFKQQFSGKMKLAVVGLPAKGIQRFRRLAENLGISNDVVFAGFVSEGDLVALYNGAELLIYPSLYEGFGLPVLEAMISGTPVITSPCGSIPEIAGDAALMVDPHDSDAIANAINEVLTDKVLCDSLVEKGKQRAGLFSWQLAAEKTFAVYQAVMVKK
jgi:glycosyltransferase involved in cell wall biosynthesis